MMDDFKLFKKGEIVLIIGPQYFLGEVLESYDNHVVLHKVMVVQFIMEPVEGSKVKIASTIVPFVHNTVVFNNPSIYCKIPVDSPLGKMFLEVTSKLVIPSGDIKNIILTEFGG